MDDKIKWKSDKQCSECRTQQRKDIIQEIKEVCKDCNRFNKIKAKDLQVKENR